MTPTVWIAFLVFILVMVALDLGVFHRGERTPTIRGALGWTLFWVGLALLFNVAVYQLYENNYGWASLATEHLSGRQAASQFLLGYLLEKSLSVDNVFVIAMVFASFGVPLALQHRVLFWGILGAVVLRGVMILFGVALFRYFDWVYYLFGALLIYSAMRVSIIRHDNIRPEDNGLVRLARRWMPLTPDFHGARFFVEIGGRRHMTPLFLALLLVESSDVMFAVDSIPAIFAVTLDPFIIFTSNVFAILGLRSLYFVLAGLMERFRQLKRALVFILVFVGIKMLLHHHWEIAETTSMAIVLGLLAFGFLASIAGAKRDTASLRSPL